ncbi:MAG: hypothetical protein E5Y14_28785 [Mesorhizobium sp.]|nr:MAG: hypothetical protein EOS18_24120 [Mesorhizobium sp.]TIN06393.1 MAG: hypothetical protein E5Y14_28785 [Mesorhizobium sp.]
MAERGAPSVLPDISPTWGRSLISPITKVARRVPSSKLPISPLVGEMSGRTEGGAVEHYLRWRLALARPGSL